MSTRRLLLLLHCEDTNVWAVAREEASTECCVSRFELFHQCSPPFILYASPFFICCILVHFYVCYRHKCALFHLTTTESESNNIFQKRLSSPTTTVHSAVFSKHDSFSSKKKYKILSLSFNNTALTQRARAHFDSDATTKTSKKNLIKRCGQYIYIYKSEQYRICEKIATLLLPNKNNNKKTQKPTPNANVSQVQQQKKRRKKERATTQHFRASSPSFQKIPDNSPNQ